VSDFRIYRIRPKILALNDAVAQKLDEPFPGLNVTHPDIKRFIDAPLIMFGCIDAIETKDFVADTNRVGVFHDRLALCVGDLTDGENRNRERKRSDQKLHGGPRPPL
jgi:hypothetical protein